jgi:hypothetical protein
LRALERLQALVTETCLIFPLPAATPDRLGYKVDISRGQRIGRVSSEWFSRPDDER